MQTNRVYIFVSAILSWLIVNTSGSCDMVSIAEQTVAGTAGAPFQYRVLAGHLLAGMANVMGALVALWLFWFVLLALFAVLMDTWLREWLPADRAAAGVYLSLLLTLAFISFQPGGAMWSGLEALFWLGALLLLAREEGRIWPYALVIFVATLNRETAVFLVTLVWLVTRRWGLSAALVIVWSVTYGGLRLAYGDVHTLYTLAEIWQFNTASYRLAYFLIGAALFSWIPVATVRGHGDAPRFLRRAAWAAVPYMAAIAVFGVWREFRLFLPLLPLAIPLVMGIDAATGSGEGHR